MRFRLVRPMVSKNSASASFIKRIPADVKPLLVGKSLTIPLAGAAITFPVTSSTQSLRFSLRTSDPLEVRVRHAETLAYVEQLFENIRSGRVVELTHRQTTALAGEFYKAWSRGPDGPGSNIKFDSVSGDILPAIEPGDEDIMDLIEEMERGAGGSAAAKLKAAPKDEVHLLVNGSVDSLLARFRFPAITEDSRRRLLAALVDQLEAARETSSRVLGGDYSPDPRLSRYPEVEFDASQIAKPKAKGSTGKESLTGLVDSWWVEAKALGKSASTYESYGNSFRLLSRFLGHDDALRVTPEDIIRFKDFRLSTPSEKTGKPVSPKTLKGSDLTAFKSVFDWAVANRKLASNPAAGVTIKMGKKVKVRERYFTDDEAAAILRGANAVDLSPSPRNSYKTRLAKRWVPWLCAYSGSRLGELVQLRKEDFRQEAGSWIMRVTPEAGTVKGKEFRDVPVHPHLIAMGFIGMVESSRGGYLFMDVKETATFRGVWQSKKNRLAEFAREYVIDPNVAPNHGWRHTFKSKGFEAGIQEKVLDALCGHAPRSTGQSYGSVTLKTKIDAIGVFPRFDLQKVKTDETE